MFSDDMVWYPLKSPQIQDLCFYFKLWPLIYPSNPWRAGVTFGLQMSTQDSLDRFKDLHLLYCCSKCPYLKMAGLSGGLVDSSERLCVQGGCVRGRWFADLTFPEKSWSMLHLSLWLLRGEEGGSNSPITYGASYFKPLTLCQMNLGSN